MSSKDDTSTSTYASSTPEGNKRMQALEAKAVAEATATADSQFVPSVSLMNSTDPMSIMKQVDGLNDLSDYEEKESVYVGRSVPIAAGGALEIPIQVGTPGSVVEYAVENKQYDFAFSITAERDDSVTLVKVRKGSNENGDKRSRTPLACIAKQFFVLFYRSFLFCFIFIRASILIHVFIFLHDFLNCTFIPFQNTIQPSRNDFD